MVNKAVPIAIGLTALVAGGAYWYLNKNKSTTTTPPVNTPHYTISVRAEDGTTQVFTLTADEVNMLVGVNILNVSVTDLPLNTVTDVMNFLNSHKSSSSTGGNNSGGNTTPPTTQHTANVTLSQTSGLAPLNVGFVLNGPTIADSILWDFGDGNKENGNLVNNHTYYTVGTFSGSVKIIYSDGQVLVKTFTVTTTGSTTTGGGGTTTPPTVDHTINLYQSASTVVQGQDVGFSLSLGVVQTSIKWDFGDGTTLDTVLNPTHFYTKLGTFNGSVTVIDTTGKQWIKTFTVTTTANPLTTLTVSIKSGPADVTFVTGAAQEFLPDERLEFQAQISGGIPPYSISWNMGDGSSQSGEFAYRSYKVGTYTIKCTVTDSKGLSQTATTVISIVPPPLSTTDAILVPDPLFKSNLCPYIISDLNTPTESLTFRGKIKSNRTDRDIICKVRIMIVQSSNNVSWSLWLANILVPAGQTVAIPFTPMGSITPNTGVKFQYYIDATEPLAGSQLHLDSGTFWLN